MRESVSAIYANGVLRLTRPLPWLEENREVQVIVEANDLPHPLEGCVGIMPDEDAAEMIRIIDDEFETIEEDD
jgi:predicted DNA-binding antitoxin AbrB/MazE fold protein